MNFNFFDWIRDGVMRSVLYGVDDAVKVMGVPPENTDTARSKIFHFLQAEEGNFDSQEPKRIANSGTSQAGKGRKLGRTIADIS